MDSVDKKPSKDTAKEAAVTGHTPTKASAPPTDSLSDPVNAVPSGGETKPIVSAVDVTPADATNKDAEESSSVNKDEKVPQLEAPSSEEVPVAAASEPETPATSEAVNKVVDEFDNMTIFGNKSLNELHQIQSKKSHLSAGRLPPQSRST